ncbi:MAG: rRNA maturation RNase YbeY [Magnetococcales bacterium]|nr:rRNA maturation RNase YbeY [Magnetococcales bacterium]
MSEVVLVNRASPPWPDNDNIDSLVKAAVGATLQAENRYLGQIEIGVMLTGDIEIQNYNHLYRGVDRATNVLAFALMDGEEDPFAGAGPIPFGDLILAYETIVREAKEQGKPFLDHVTHLVVHGTLHLLGYDHERSSEEALHQEEREIAVLATLNLPNPYG